MRLLVIHYHRHDHLYLDWDLWVWPSSPQSQPGAGYSYQQVDEFGAVFEIPIEPGIDQVGFLLRRGEDRWIQKDREEETYLPIAQAKTEVWVAEGQPSLFFSDKAAKKAIFPRAKKAYLDTPTIITLSFFDSLSQGQQMFLSVQDTSTSVKWQASLVPSSPAHPHFVQLILPEPIDVTHPCVVTGTIAEDVVLVPRRVLDDANYVYPDANLGCQCQFSATQFRLWAPTATTVHLHLFRDESGPLYKAIPMQKGTQGTWYTSLPGDWHGSYYLYHLESHRASSFAVDPYAKALSADRSRGLIVDLDRTNPPEWKDDPLVSLDRPTDAIIYETHLRDFSVDSSSGAIHPGQYVQFLDRNLRTSDGLVSGIDHLLELGITHIQLLPVNEFGRYEERNPDEYNWGYDPRFYMTPDGRYASTRTGINRIVEMKQMIHALHQQKIGVILDVVFNHAYHPIASSLHKLVPEYFFRTDDDGNFTNGAGVGNELATERPMVRRLILDALLYWQQEFHIDGFRFDLMALIGKKTMKEVATKLRQLRPDILLYGEPWSAGPSGIFGDELLDKGEQKNTGLAVFNDHLRDALVGSVFDRKLQGFVTGRMEVFHEVKKGVVGSIAYQGVLEDFAASPCETVNYVSCHDNLTLWDRIHISEPWETEHLKIAMDLMAQALVLFSQGIPFLQSGEEFLRTKHGKENTYLAGDHINALDWHRKFEYFPVFSYYKGLIELRKSHPAFRMSSAELVNQHLEFLQTYPPLLAWMLKNHANGDAWRHIVILINPLRTVANFSLPDGLWVLVVDDRRAGVTPIGYIEKQSEVAPLSCQVLYQ